MTVNRTTLLDLPLPVTGTESGTWGDTTNNGLTQYVDIAVAGMTSLTSANFTAGALTLANTTGDSSATNIAAGSAQYGAIKVSSLATNSTITAPSSNRRYTIINADATYSVTIKASGQTGVVIAAGEKALVAFNGTDYVKVATANGTGEFTTVDTTNLEVTNIKAKDGTAAATIADSTGVVTVTAAPVLSALTASQAVFTTAGKALTSNAITGTGNVVMSASPTLTGTVSAAAATLSSDLTLNGGTANGVLYLNGSKVATSGSALTFDGTTATTPRLALGGTTLPAAGTATLFSRSSDNNTYLQTGSGNSFVVLDGSQDTMFQASPTLLGFNINNSEQMRLTSTGLGIGTSSPAYKLDVVGNAQVSGYMGVGGAGAANKGLYQRNTALTGATQYGITAEGTFNSAATGGGVGFASSFATEAAAFTMANAIGFRAFNVTLGAGSAITNQYGLLIDDQTRGTNNYGITSTVSSGTNKWNIYASGTAANYFAGSISVGGTLASWLSPAIQTGVSSLYSNSNDTYLTSNSNFNSGAWSYIVSDYAAQYYQVNGDHVFRTAPSGTAGDPVTFTERFRLSATEAVFNDPGNDYDFRVESDTNTHAFFVQGSDGNVGIGTSSPGNFSGISLGDSILDVNGVIQVRGDATNGVAALQLGGDTYRKAAISTPVGTDTPYMAFSTASSGSSSSATERMRLDSSGNLGIGTSSPISGSGLTVADATYPAITIASLQNNSSWTQNQEYGKLAFYSSDSTGLGAGETAKISVIADTSSTTYPAGALAFFTSNRGVSTTITERMRLDSSGNLGLGVTPSGWVSTWSTYELRTGDTNSYITGATDESVIFGVNGYYDTGWKYKTTGFAASNYYQINGTHVWRTAASGTAGNAITFTQALTLDANRNLLLNGTSAGASAVGTLAIFNGTAPTGSVTNGIILYAEDVSSSSELKVRDEAGNVTTLSPHNFSLIPEGPSEDMAWAYYSEKGGKRINVDMLKLARMVEKLTGEKLVYES